MRRSLLALLFTLISGTVAAECECIWRGSFSKVQADSDLVVAGEVLGGKGNAIDLRVDKLMRGDNHQDNIRIWLKTGDYCRPQPQLFPAGSNWVMILNRIDEDIAGGFDPNTPNLSYGRIGDYILSSCGGYWLGLHDGWVTGNLIDAPRWEREPKMTPVLLDLLEAYIGGKVDAEALLEASQEDPALRELKLNTRAFLRKKQ